MDIPWDEHAVAESTFYEKYFDCKRLDKIAKEEIPEVIDKGCRFDQDFISDILTMLDAEADAAKLRMHAAYIGMKAHEEDYIQTHQIKFMEIAGGLWQQLHAHKLSTKTHDTGIYHICQHLYDIIQDLLNFLEATSPYYNRQAWIIPIYRAIHVYHFKNQESTFLHILKRHKTDEYLINILTKTIRHLIDDRYRNTITWNTLKYLYILQERITKFAPATDEATEALHNLLLSINFNNVEYYDYIIRHLNNKIIHLPDDSTRLDGIFIELHSIALLDVGHEPLYADQPALVPRVSKWLENQVRLYQSKLKLKPALPETNVMVYPMANPEQTPLPAPVEHIALWTRLVKEAYALPMLKKEMVQLVVNLFRSRRSGPNGMAEKYLSNAMNAPTDETLDAVEKILQRMLNIIRDIRRGLKTRHQ